jgi:hypothetical protein
MNKEIYDEEETYKEERIASVATTITRKYNNYPL